MIKVCRDSQECNNYSTLLQETHSFSAAFEEALSFVLVKAIEIMLVFHADTRHLPCCGQESQVSFVTAGAWAGCFRAGLPILEVNNRATRCVEWGWLAGWRTHGDVVDLLWWSWPHNPARLHYTQPTPGPGIRRDLLATKRQYALPNDLHYTTSLVEQDWGG